MFALVGDGEGAVGAEETVWILKLKAKSELSKQKRHDNVNITVVSGLQRCEEEVQTKCHEQQLSLPVQELGMEFSVLTPHAIWLM